MRSPPLYFAACLSLSLASEAGAAGSASDAKTVIVTATISTRTSLRVSTQLLQFDVGADGHAVSVVDFAAGARTRDGEEVFLTVEPLAAVSGPDGASVADTSLSFAGDGVGTLSGRVVTSAPTVTGRWQGSGLRAGRLLFSLRASVPGRYTVPVRFLLTAP